MSGVRLNLQRLNQKIARCERMATSKTPLLISMGVVEDETELGNGQRPSTVTQGRVSRTAGGARVFSQQQ